MVSKSDVLNSNESLKSAGSGLVAVFVGATNGIGLATLRALLKHTDSPTVYVIGRSKARVDALIASTLQPLNAAAQIHAVEAADLTLVRDAGKAAEEIKGKVDKVDLLILSPGYLAMGRDESPEGLDRLTSIRFYSRMKFVDVLLPKLREAPHARVITVLAGGQEGKIDPEDMMLAKPGAYGLLSAGALTASLNTLFFEQLAAMAENRKIVFIHLFPGVVSDTGLTIKDAGAVLKFFLDWVASPMMKLFGYTPEECGERVLFAATNGRFRRQKNEDERQQAKGTLIEKGSDGELGSGMYLVQANSSVVVGGSTLKKMREDGMAMKVYHHTMDEFARIGS